MLVLAVGVFTHLIFVDATFFGLFPEDGVRPLLVAPVNSAFLLEFCIHDF